MHTFVLYKNLFMRDFILDHPDIKPFSLAKQIGWNKGSMYHYLKGRRDIPKKKAKELEKVLKDYGYGVSKSI